VGFLVKRLLTKESLTIFVDGEEVPGVIVYGLLAPRSEQNVTFPSDAWIASPEVEDFSLYGEGWKVLTWEVPVVLWPPAQQFQAAVRATLEAMVERGSRVAWIGAEGVPYCDPPDLFSPHCMSGGVLAWMTDSGDCSYSLNPDGPLTPVGDEVLLQLRHHARGLADVT
jgi:hypothetical protein